MYAQKIGIYQGDCKVLLGKYKMFSDYIHEFSVNIREKEKGLDCGTGPGGVNAKFFQHCSLDGCDIEKPVIDSLPSIYSKTFIHDLSKDIFPYENNSLDFIICSCVIQHLNSVTELEFALEEFNRILKSDGKLYLMFKAGSHDQSLIHFNEYYNEQRSFRVFSPQGVLNITKKNFINISQELLLDDNWIPYCCLILKRI